MKTSQHDAAMDDPDIQRENEFSGASRIITLSVLLFILLGVWAWFGTLDEVSTGTGKVVPSSREQILQSLDGGIVTQLLVHEGDKVEAGQIVAQLDPTRSQSNVGESAARYRASLASSVRLNAEVNDLPLVFPGAAWDTVAASSGAAWTVSPEAGVALRRVLADFARTGEVPARSGDPVTVRPFGQFV